MEQILSKVSPLRRVGFFAELVGREHAPRLKGAREKLDVATAAAMVAYLRSGKMLSVGAGSFDDVLEPSHRRVVPIGVLTDGKWMWRSDLAYYVERYRVELPSEFVEDARQRSWRAPMIPDAELPSLEARALIAEP